MDLSPITLPLSMSSASVGVPSHRLFAPRVTSVTNDKVDIEMIPRAVHRSPGICLSAEKSTGKLQLGDFYERDVRPVSTSNGDHYIYRVLLAALFQCIVNKHEYINSKAICFV